MFPGLRRRREQRRRSRDWRIISADIRRGRDQRQFSLVGQEPAVAQLEAQGMPPGDDWVSTVGQDCALRVGALAVASVWTGGRRGQAMTGPSG